MITWNNFKDGNEMASFIIQLSVVPSVVVALDADAAAADAEKELSRCFACLLARTSSAAWLVSLEIPPLFGARDIIFLDLTPTCRSYGRLTGERTVPDGWTETHTSTYSRNGNRNQVFIQGHVIQRHLRPGPVSSLTKREIFRCLRNWSNDIGKRSIRDWDCLFLDWAITAVIVSPAPLTCTFSLNHPYFINRLCFQIFCFHLIKKFAYACCK